jgi:hypothetical protein
MAELRYTARELLELYTAKSKDLLEISTLLQGRSHLKKDDDKLKKEFDATIAFRTDNYLKKYLKGDK